MAGAF